MAGPGFGGVLMALPAIPIGVWKIATAILGGVVTYEVLLDEPEVIHQHQYGPDWKGYAVLSLAALGGFYLASRVVK